MTSSTSELTWQCIPKWWPISGVDRF